MTRWHRVLRSAEQTGGMGFAAAQPILQEALRLSLGDAQQLSLQPVCPPIVITGLDPVICTSTVPREITGSSPVMTRRDAPTRLVYCWASPVYNIILSVGGAE